MDPRVIHGYICLTGFLPMYIAAGFGVEFPVVS